MTRQATSPVRTDLYPSAKLTLIVRFEEFGDTRVQQQAPAKPVNVVRGTGQPLAPLVAQADQSVPGASRYVLVPRGQDPTPAGGPQQQGGSLDGYTQVVAAVIPKRATWNQNGVRAGDTLTTTIKFIDCPIDPRTIRSCAVQFFFGTVSGEDFAAGVAGETRAASNGDTRYLEPLNLLPDTYVDDDGNQRTNLRFEGFVDSKWEVTFDSDSEPVIELECLDNTHLLVNIEAPPKLAVDPKLPVDQAIAKYLANFPSMNGLAVEYRPASQPGDWPTSLPFPPTFGAILAGSAYQPDLGPTPSKGGGGAEKLNVWDYLTDLAGAMGHAIYVQGTTIVITQVQTLLGGGQGAGSVVRRDDDPFTGRVVDGESFQYRRLIWGRNLGRMVVRRGFTKQQPKNIEVRSYNARRKKLNVVRFPDPVSQKALLAVASQPGDGATEQKWQVWRVGKNIDNLDVLRLIAQNIYQSTGRMNLELELETANLGSFGAGTLDPDILDARAGDTLEVLTVRDRDYSGVTETEEGLLGDAEQLMTGLGFSRDFAAAAGKAYVNAAFTTLFRLRTMSLDWDPESEEPVKLELHLVNYVEVRAGAPLQQG